LGASDRDIRDWEKIEYEIDRKNCDWEQVDLEIRDWEKIEYEIDRENRGWEHVT
jgi:hypothetical protein